MSPSIALLEQCFHLLLLVAWYVITGKMVLFGSRIKCRAVGFAFLCGFFVTPILTYAISYVTGISLSTSFIATFIILAIFAFLGHQLVPPTTIWKAVAEKKDSRFFILFLFFVSATPCINYLLWSCEVNQSAHAVFFGTSIFDFEKHLGVTTSLAAFAAKPVLFCAPDVGINYYTGFYIIPAAFASGFNGGVLSFLVAQFICSGMVLYAGVFYSSRVIWKERWCAYGAVMAVMCGLALGLRTIPSVVSWVEAHPLLAVFYYRPNHIESIFALQQWLPQHVASLGIGLLLLVGTAQWNPSEYYRNPLTVCMVVFVLIGSTFISVFVMGAAALWITGWLIQRAICDGRVFVKDIGFLIVSFLAILILGLPVYAPIVTVVLSSGGHTKSVSALTSNEAYNVGYVITSCGLGLVSLLILPWRASKNRALMILFLLALVGLMASLSFGYYSDVLHKALATVQVVIPILLFATVKELFSSTSPAWKRVGGVLFVGMLLNGVASFAYSVKCVRDQIGYTPFVDRSCIQLMDWIKKNTDMDAFVSFMTADTTYYEMASERVAFASGSNMFKRLEYVLGDPVLVDRYKREYNEKIQGIRNSDYIIPVTEHMWGTFRLFGTVAWPEPSDIEQLYREEFVPVFTNDAGVIYRKKRDEGRNL